MEADWEKIRLEYITTPTSYRRLAKEYGVPEGTIYARGNRERWVEQRENFERTTTEAPREDACSEELARVSRFLAVTDKLLEKVSVLAEREETITPANLKTLSDVMKNIKEVQMIRSHRELLEQDVRIEKLRKDLGRQEIQGNAITVTLEGVEKFAE